jgi:hypothetical protein
MVCSLHWKWKREYDNQLRDAKQTEKKKLQNAVFSTAIGSKARRAYQLVHKNACMSLPADMKDPTDPKKMVTGHKVNEIWEVLQPQQDQIPCLQPQPNPHKSLHGLTQNFGPI